MRFSDLIHNVWNNVWRNRLRTFLTLIAVAIGCTSIIVMISLALGLKSNAEREIMNQGNLLEIRIYGKVKNKATHEFSPIVKEDINKVRELPNIEAVLTPRNLSQQAMVKLNNYSGNGQVVGVNVDEYRKRPHKMYQGRYFDQSDNSIVVNYSFGENLMTKAQTEALKDNIIVTNTDQKPKKHYVNILNKTLLLTFQKKSQDGTLIQKKIPVKVSGVLEKPENPWEEGQPLIYMSNKLLEEEIIKWTGNPDGGIEPIPPGPDGKPIVVSEFQEVIAMVDKISNIESASQSLDKENYAYNSIYKNMEEAKLVFLIIQVVLGGIGAISLIVASIGIVNTMIMSIMERTREIGIMKVVGANLSTIRKMFLLEAGYIGLFGGLLGAVFSVMLSLVINIGFKIFVRQQAGVNAPQIGDISIIPSYLILGAVAFSFIVGLGAGYLPANRAVKLSVLDAIRKD